MNRNPRNVFVIGDRCLCPTQIVTAQDGIHLSFVVPRPATVVDLRAPLRRVRTDGGGEAWLTSEFLERLPEGGP